MTTKNRIATDLRFGTKVSDSATNDTWALLFRTKYHESRDGFLQATRKATYKATIEAGWDWSVEGLI